MENMEENFEMIWKLWKIQKKIVKRYENMEETQVEM
jgi:hypothetical protein